MFNEISFALVLSAVIGPASVGVVAGWLSSRWASKLNWLSNEIERRSSFYSELLGAVSEIAVTLPLMYHSELANRPDETDDEFDLPRETLSDAETAEVANISVRRWRDASEKSKLFSSGVVAIPVSRADGRLNDLLDAYLWQLPIQDIKLLSKSMHGWLEVIPYVVERDMIDLRRITVNGLPRKQRKAEVSHLNEMSIAIERKISHSLKFLEAVADEQEKSDKYADLD